MYVLVRIEDEAVQEVLGTYKELLDAEQALSKIYEECSQDEIIGYDDDYVQIENSYGSIETYQFFFVSE